MGKQATGVQCCSASRNRVGPNHRRGSRMSGPFTLSSRFGFMLLDGGFASGPESWRRRTITDLTLGRAVSTVTPRSSISTRKGSATDHACAKQPRGRCGASASKTSDTWPRQPSCRWASRPARKPRALFRTAVLWPNAFIQAVTNGPSKKGQTVPW